MDPICHTLVGASLGATGLEKKTRYGRATLIIAANLPDIDVVSAFWGEAATVAFRRGLTHGLPALFILPVLLAVAMTLVSRLRAKPGTHQQPSFRWFLVLSLIGVATHPVLDSLNTYGMRWLMPFVDRWFYLDTLFIVDWVVWLALLIGLLLAGRAARTALRWYRQPAPLALTFVLCYIFVNFSITQLAEQATLEETVSNPPRRVMASPVALNFLVRNIVLDYGTEYRLGTVRFGLPPRFEWDETVIAKGSAAAFERARQQRQGRRFLGWARFPYAVVEESDDETTVILADARYVPELANPRFDNFGIVMLKFSEP